ncbi:MAG: transporter permease [Caulobacteraceae bacterium]|nr:transporter permease [Caulobacteraceae bacterium]
MWRNYLAAALRNLSRNRLHSVITTLSLAIGFTAIILASLFWRYEHSYDQFWPNADRLTLAAQWRYDDSDYILASDAADLDLASRIADLPQVQTVTRMAARPMLVTHGQIAVIESDLVWADPNLFSVLTPRVAAGDLKTALSQPNSIVLTRGLARKYFGDGDPMGQVITLSPPPRGSVTSRAAIDQSQAPLAVQVTAVIEDIPVHSHVRAVAFVSGMSRGSPLEPVAARPETEEGVPRQWAGTYVLMPSAADRAGLQLGLNDLARRDYAAREGKPRSEFRALPLEQVYLKPPRYFGDHQARASNQAYMKRGDGATLASAGIAAGLMMVVASINFIILMTARGAGRAVEVGIRKASGARRRDLVAQFVGECLIHAGLAFILGLAGTELAIPLFNKVSGLEIGFDYGRDAGLVAQLLAAALAIGAVAGVYPALALSALRPSQTLKGGPVKLLGSSRLRQGLIAAQFIPLIVLGLGTLALARDFQKEAGIQLTLMDPQTLLINETCTPALKTQIAALPGVAQIACMPNEIWYARGRITALSPGGWSDGSPRNARGQPLGDDVWAWSVDYGALEIEDMKPLAGQLFSPSRTADQDGVVINDSARRRLGFASAASAIGQGVIFEMEKASRQIRIVGVVEDRGGGVVPAEFFRLDPAKAQGGMGIRLKAGQPGSTLAAIDKLWAAQGQVRPMRRGFYGERVRQVGTDRPAILGALSACIGIGVFVAAIGLFGLSAFLAQQRTKEIGVRKALGANRGQVLRRLLVQFAWPVILANLITCPLFYVGVEVVSRSIRVSDRIPIGPEVYLLVIAGSMLIAFMSVFSHAWQVSGQRPVKALRYE